MPAAVNTDLERERLDEIFAQVEAELNGELPLPSERNAGTNANASDMARAKRKAETAAEREFPAVYGNVQGYIRDDVFKTRRERFLALAYAKLYEAYAAMKPEYELYKTFTVNVSTRLDAATRTAREQNNHHYFKMFADYVARLLEKM